VIAGRIGRLEDYGDNFHDLLTHVFEVSVASCFVHQLPRCLKLNLVWPGLVCASMLSTYFSLSHIPYVTRVHFRSRDDTSSIQATLAVSEKET